MNETPSISVVVPLFNEQDNVDATVRAIEAAFGPRCARYEIVLVDDGSADSTGALCDKLAVSNPLVRVVHHEINLGYGAALRSGFGAARFPIIFYTDGDLQFDLEEIDRLLPLLEGADIVTGFRINRQDPWHRRVNAGFYNFVMRTLFGVQLRDLDCAFKLYRKSIFEKVAMRSDGILISGEILVQAVHHGMVIRETGVTHYPRRRGAPTGNNPLVVLVAMWELVKFCWSQRRLRGVPDLAADELAERAGQPRSAA